MAGPAFRAAAVRVRVPATSANLGPGFDAFGLSLGLYDDVVVRVADSGLHIDIAGEGSETLPRDERHLLVRSLRTAFDLLGGQPRGLEIVCANRIPHGRGLGSSAAAVVAGLLAGRALVADGPDRLDDDDLLGLAAAMEGHPDNAAAALLGGLTLAWSADGSVRAVRLDPRPEVHATILVPEVQLSTETARGLLPATVPHADAALTAGRAALLVAALTAVPAVTGVLLAATEDRLHQAQRGPAMPATEELVTRLRAMGRAAVVSGAGPTVLVLDEGEPAPLEAPPGWRVLSLAVAEHGATASRSRPR